MLQRLHLLKKQKEAQELKNLENNSTTSDINAYRKLQEQKWAQQRLANKPPQLVVQSQIEDINMEAFKKRKSEKYPAKILVQNAKFEFTNLKDLLRFYLIVDTTTNTMLPRIRQAHETAYTFKFSVEIPTEFPFSAPFVKSVQANVNALQQGQENDQLAKDIEHRVKISSLFKDSLMENTIERFVCKLIDILIVYFEEQLAREEERELYDKLKISDGEFKETKTVIGKSATGVIRVASYKNQQVAVKTFLYKKDESDLGALIDEIRVLRSLNHSKVLHYYGYFLVKQKFYLKLIMEYAENGTLSDVLYGKKTTIKKVVHEHSQVKMKTNIEFNKKRLILLNDSTYLLDIALDIARGVQYLHAQRIIHRNIQPSHILIMKDWTAKIAIDLRHLYRLREEETAAPAGTSVIIPQYSSPEEFSNNDHSFCVDAFSFGVVLNEMWRRKKPWAHIVTSSISKRITVDEERDPIAGEAPEQIQALIQKCWSQDPNQRPSFDAIVHTLEKIKQQL